MKQAHIFISGFVQGVGFRQFVKKEAKKLGLNGWVRNLPDNSVEAIFQSEKKREEATLDIERIINLCRKGPFLSEVKQVIVKWEEYSLEEKKDDFIILKPSL